MLYGGSATKGSASSSAGGSHGHTATVGSAGGTNNTFSLIQPYLSVYMWKRTAQQTVDEMPKHNHTAALSAYQKNHYHGFGYNSGNNSGRFVATSGTSTFDLASGVGYRKWNGSGGGGGFNSTTSDAKTCNMVTTLNKDGTTTSGYKPSISISTTGGGKAHNNFQPYLTCYMWKRVS